MPASDGFEFAEARDDLVPTEVRFVRQGLEINWTPEAEVALRRARDSMEIGDDFEAYRPIGLAAAAQTEYEENGILLGFATIAICGFVLGLGLMGGLWLVFG